MKKKDLEKLSKPAGISSDSASPVLWHAETHLTSIPHGLPVVVAAQGMIITDDNETVKGARDGDVDSLLV